MVAVEVVLVQPTHQARRRTQAVVYMRMALFRLVRHQAHLQTGLMMSARFYFPSLPCHQFMASARQAQVITQLLLTVVTADDVQAEVAVREPSMVLHQERAVTVVMDCV